MIKDFESFINGENIDVNEGLIGNFIDAIDAGIQGFKLSRNSEKAVEDEAERMLSGKKETATKTVMSILVKRLVEQSVWVAREYSWEKLFNETANLGGLDYVENKLEKIEDIISKMREIMDGIKNGKIDERDHLAIGRY
jgi:hypothetical protein